MGIVVFGVEFRGHTGMNTSLWEHCTLTYTSEYKSIFYAHVSTIELDMMFGSCSIKEGYAFKI